MGGRFSGQAYGLTRVERWPCGQYWRVVEQPCDDADRAIQKHVPKKFNIWISRALRVEERGSESGG